ncbi:MAG: NAD-binding protein [Nostocoides sp.]
MANPLLLLVAAPTLAKRARAALRSKDIPVPQESPETDAIFIVLRRMRAPLILLILIFSVSVLGLALIPGRDDTGAVVHMSAFDAFYFMSYTATTIGFGELPHTFTVAQRMWVTGSIYASVVGWAYAVATLFALVGDQGLRMAVAAERFRRRVRRLREPFVLVAGCGHAGLSVCRSLDLMDRRFVVVDIAADPIEGLAAADLRLDPPALMADASAARVLGLAGMGSPHCEAVLALTGDDEANLAIVLAAQLLRPDMPVIARTDRRITEVRMRDFEPDAVVNPYDRYGSYLVQALQRPVAYQLTTWLTSAVGTPLAPLREGLASGPWVVCSDDPFGIEVATDLRSAGLTVDLVDLSETPDPDVLGAVGFVAGTTLDTTNISLATRARITEPTIFVSVRQESSGHTELLSAVDLDSVFIPSDLVARETVARLVAPGYWTFIAHAGEQDETWCAGVRDILTQQLGDRLPPSWPLHVTAADTPALVRRLAAGHAVTLRDLLRHPDDREERLHMVALMLIRDDTGIAMPELDEPLRTGDELVLTGWEHPFALLRTTVHVDHVLAYVVAGRQVPSTWIGRRLTGRRAL